MDRDTGRQTSSLSHLAVEAFLILRNTFFDANGTSVPFRLRPKRNTQDDPLDERINQILGDSLSDAKCLKAPGPLITPDMVLLREELCRSVERAVLRSAPERIIALEVKKLERAKTGEVARASGLDYNTTPPCGTVRVYDEADNPVDIRGFYIFVCLERAARVQSKVIMSALVLCDGNILNADFNLYLSIVGQRTKETGLGTYRDGVDRQRPMLIFSNPLGIAQIDRACSLVLGEDTLVRTGQLQPAYRIFRTIPESGKQAGFVVYRLVADLATGHQVEELVDPFPVPTERQATTQRRGRFVLPL